MTFEVKSNINDLEKKLNHLSLVFIVIHEIKLCLYFII